MKAASFIFKNDDGVSSSGKDKMRYDIIVKDNEKSLIIAVNKLLDNGWKLAGGVSVSVSEDEYYCCEYYAQALVKEK